MTPDAELYYSPIVDQRMSLVREWDELVAEVRRIQGFEDFLRPPKLAALLPAAANGPVAVINVSRWRCDALLVTADGVAVTELRKVSLETVAEKANDYYLVLQRTDLAMSRLEAALHRYSSGDHGADAVRQYTQAKEAVLAAARQREQTLAAVLAWLWDDVAEPVLASLGLDRRPGPDEAWPRMWWCPTGPLTLLPLHAAGYHDDGGRSSASTVLDRVVSSYTPTLRALLEAQRPLDPDPDQQRILLVALAETPGQVPLTDVARERDLLTRLFPGHLTLLQGESATTGAVRAALPSHRWAHFSCHGGQNLLDPSLGGLLLHDGRLNVGDISQGYYRGEFAFLSACMTAVGGITLLDEVITLAAALHYGGYRHVIGTLWSVYDQVAADVAELVYADLTASGRFEPGRSAFALHRAIRQLRDGQRLPPSAWVPFTHTGP